MTIPRSRLINPELSLWYHCISGCVQGAFLLKEGVEEERKKWIEDRLELLASVFAIAVGSFAILDNHLHLVLGLQPLKLASLSDQEILDRWYQLYWPKGSNRKPLNGDALQTRREKDLNDGELMAELRTRIGSISWFSKLLKEPLAQKINKELGRRGTFFEGRFKSIAAMDEEALLTMSVYVDLNVYAAGLAPTPETSKFTSIRARIEHVKRLGRVDDLAAAQAGSVAATLAGQGLNEGLWLAPIGEPADQEGTNLHGMYLDLPLGIYVWLVDYSARLVREGKASLPPAAPSIFERLGTTAQAWGERLVSLLNNRLIGRFFASTQEQLDKAAKLTGLSRVMNLAGIPVL
jgi:hypothetical protein